MDFTMNAKPAALSEFVINYHLNEACNYQCNYCYSKWVIPAHDKNTQDITDKLAVISELSRFISSDVNINPLSRIAKWNNVRLNFSGGEPMLIKRLNDLIHHTTKLGMRASVVTNGSLLTESWLAKVAPHLHKIGVSIDGVSDEIIDATGRRTRSGRRFNPAHVISMLKKAREFNPNIIIKINTVVSAYNLREDFTTIIKSVNPDEWSIIQVLPFFDKGAAITTQEFNYFKEYHLQEFKDLLFSEDNDDYKVSFLMVAPNGRFFSNSAKYNDQEYQYSEKINEVGMKTALDQIDFDFTKYIKRYQEMSAVRKAC